MSDIGDLGRFGELEFKKWCASIGLVANGSLEQDATGWDCKVEYKKLLKNDDMYSLQPENSLSHPVFDVQVKTTQKEKNKWPIKLEHLVRFAHSPHPAFLCIINAGLKKSITNHIYLIHIDKKHIPKILKKQRKLSKDGKNIYGKTMSISASDTDLIKDNFHEEIEKRFKDVVGNSLQEYTAQKDKTLKKVGYKGHHGTLKFKASLDSINNHILGLNDTSDVQDISIVDNRFGISIEKIFTDALVKFEADKIEGNLFIMCNNIIKLSLPIKLRKSIFDIDKLSSSPYLSISHEAFKIVLYYNKIIITPNSQDDKLSFVNSKIFSMIRAYMNGNCKFNIFMNLDSLELPFQYEGNPNIVENSKNWSAQVWMLNEIESLGLNIHDVKMQEIMEQSNVISFMSMIQNNQEEQITIGLTPNTPEGENLFMSSKDGEILFNLVIYLDDISYYFFYKMSSFVVTKDVEVEIKSRLSNINFLECVYLEEVNDENINKLWNGIYKKYSIKSFPEDEYFFLSFDYVLLNKSREDYQKDIKY